MNEIKKNIKGTKIDRNWREEGNRSGTMEDWVSDQTPSCPFELKDEAKRSEEMEIMRETLKMMLSGFFEKEVYLAYYLNKKGYLTFKRGEKPNNLTASANAVHRTATKLEVICDEIMEFGDKVRGIVIDIKGKKKQEKHKERNKNRKRRNTLEGI